MKTPQPDAQSAQRLPAATSLEKSPASVQAATGDSPLVQQQAIAHSPRALTQRRSLQRAFGDALQPQSTERGHGDPAPQPASQLTPREAAQRQTLAASFGPALQRQPVGDSAPPNQTGMPGSLKAGIESMSGMDMSEVRVHRNASKPAQLNAQGNDIHLGPGQEQNKRQLPSRAKPGGPAILQAVWPFDGPSIFSSAFWNGDIGQQQDNVPEPLQSQPLTRKQQQRLHEQQAKKLGTERRRITQARLQELPQQLRLRLVAAETMMSNAAATLPVRVREPWATDDPAAVEASIRPAIQALPLRPPNTRFKYERDADEAEAATEQLEIMARKYKDYVDAMQAALVLPCQYFVTYANSLAVGLPDRINAVCLLIEQGARAPSDIIALFAGLLRQAQEQTAISSTALFAEMSATPMAARQRIAGYFALGRLRIGHNRSFYASEHDAPAGSFGGEWALQAPDDTLADVAKKWVYHTHCGAVGDKSTHTYESFQIRRSIGASHIKRIDDRELNQVSITVDVPAEFDRIEAQDKDRFLDWLTTPKGGAAIRRQRHQ